MRPTLGGLRRPPPPSDLADLGRRAAALEGLTLSAVARALGALAPRVGPRTKGKVGELLERALGATGKSTATQDFPELGVELKTIPVDARMRPTESTYVCTIVIAEAERAEWATSWARQKLSHVLWLPVVDRKVIGRACFWRPSVEQDGALRADFELLMGTIGAGRIEDLTARDGVHLQVRPKAKDGSVRTVAWDRDGDPISTVPRGFYLRPTFTASILAGSS